MNYRFAMFLLLCVPGCWPGIAPAQEIEPTDVLLRVKRVVKELERIRFAMGKPKNGNEIFVVADAAPREVYFQARTLCRKADRLCFEQLRERAPPPRVPEEEIEPRHVAEVIDAVLARIDKIEVDLPADTKVSADQRDPKKTSTDVFRAIVTANRQISLLLEKQVSPSDVYQEVTLAMSYASSLLASVPDAVRNPEPDELEAGKQPADVFLRLIRCFGIIRNIADNSGLKLLELSLPEGGESATADVVPSDVLDIASLLVSELTYLHDHLLEKTPPRKTYFPGRKFPSHVYQRVGILEKQLLQLETYGNAHPDWLREER